MYNRRERGKFLFPSTAKKENTWEMRAWKVWKHVAGVAGCRQFFSHARQLSAVPAVDCVLCLPHFDAFIRGHPKMTSAKGRGEGEGKSGRGLKLTVWDHGLISVGGAWCQVQGTIPLEGSGLLISDADVIFWRPLMVMWFGDWCLPTWLVITVTHNKLTSVFAAPVTDRWSDGKIPSTFCILNLQYE